MHRALLLATAALVAAGVAHASPPPREVPGPGAAASTGGSYVVGALEGATSRRILERAGAVPAGGRAWRVPGAAARATVLSLDSIGLLLWSERNRPFRRASALEGAGDGWGRSAVGIPAGPTPNAPAVAVIDDPVDPSTPDLPGVRSIGAPFGPASGAHGTQVASVVAGIADGRGVVGVLPGAPIVSVGLSELDCATIGGAIHRAIDARVAVITMSFGGDPCFAMYAALQRAVAEGIVLVASAGNDFEQGNAVAYPAAYPHVLSVGALDRSDRSSAFSTANLGVDLSAPGEGIAVATPPRLDVTDGVADGLELVDGTSFSAPMVAAAAAWVRSVRPQLSSDQVGDVLMASARDVWRDGYDVDTGYGALHVDQALRIAPLAKDRLEPNDEIASVDGTVFRRADPFVWAGGAPRALRATGDFANDPYDVYRIRVPARAGVSVALTAGRSDPDLIVLDRTARSVDDRRALVTRSTRPQGQRDSVRVGNRSRSAQTAYVVVDFRGERSLDGEYRLSFRRTRGRR